MSRRAPLFALGLLACLLAGYGFLQLAQAWKENTPLQRFDLELAHSMASGRVAFLGVVLFAITLLASLQVMFVLVPLIAIFLWTRGQRRAAVAVLVCGIGSGLSNKYLKESIERPRPQADLRYQGVWENNESFPSGHASSSLAVFGLLGFLCWRDGKTSRQRLWGPVGFALLILAIGFSRIYLCAHFFTDVLGGYLLGLVWLLLAIAGLVLAEDRPASSAAAH